MLDSPVRPAARPVRPLVRLALAALLLAGGLGQLACAAVPGDLPTLVARAQRGEVRVVQVGGEDPPGLLLGAGGDRRQLLWLDRYGLRHRVLLPGPAYASSAGGPTGQDVVATVRAAAPSGLQPREVAPGELVRERLARLVRLVELVLLALLVFGPQPRRATKCAWAWVLGLVPFGGGAALLLWREAPWSPATTAEREPADRSDRAPGVRTSGGSALSVLLVLGLLLSVLTGLAVRATALDDPRQPDDYSVVRNDGTILPGVLQQY